MSDGAENNNQNYIYDQHHILIVAAVLYAKHLKKSSFSFVLLAVI